MSKIIVQEPTLALKSPVVKCEQLRKNETWKSTETCTYDEGVVYTFSQNLFPVKQTSEMIQDTSSPSMLPAVNCKQLKKTKIEKVIDTQNHDNELHKSNELSVCQIQTTSNFEKTLDPLSPKLSPVVKCKALKQTEIEKALGEGYLDEELDQFNYFSGCQIQNRSNFEKAFDCVDPLPPKLSPVVKCKQLTKTEIEKALVRPNLDKELRRSNELSVCRTQPMSDVQKTLDPLSPKLSPVVKFKPLTQTEIEKAIGKQSLDEELHKTNGLPLSYLQTELYPCSHKMLPKVICRKLTVAEIQKYTLNTKHNKPLDKTPSKPDNQNEIKDIEKLSLIKRSSLKEIISERSISKISKTERSRSTDFISERSMSPICRTERSNYQNRQTDARLLDITTKISLTHRNHDIEIGEYSFTRKDKTTINLSASPNKYFNPEIMELCIDGVWIEVLRKSGPEGFEYQCFFCTASNEEPMSVAQHTKESHTVSDQFKRLIMDKQCCFKCRHCDFLCINSHVCWMHLINDHRLVIKMISSGEPEKYSKLPVPHSDKKALFHCPADNCKFAAKDITMSVHHLYHYHGKCEHIRPGYFCLLVQKTNEALKILTFMCALCKFTSSCENHIKAHCLYYHLEKSLLFVCEECNLLFESRDWDAVMNHCDQVHDKGEQCLSFTILDESGQELPCSPVSRCVEQHFNTDDTNDQSVISTTQTRPVMTVSHEPQMDQVLASNQHPPRPNMVDEPSTVHIPTSQQTGSQCVIHVLNNIQIDSLYCCHLTT